MSCHHGQHWLRAATAAIILGSAANAGASGNDCECVGDINGDGTINGADLAAVLGAWGTANPAADLNGDGTVNGADLAIVLGKWGPCTPPANNDCTNAQIIGPGWHPFCTTYATTDGPGISGACGDANQVYNDIWYQFAPLSDGVMTVETCSAANFDTVIAVYSAVIPGISPCPTDGIGLATFIGCNDDFPGCSGLTSKFVANVTAGKVYKIRLGGFNLNSRGAGTLKLSFTHAGESCANPKNATFSLNQTFVGNTSDNAVDATVPTNCFGGFGQGPMEWISYTATCPGILTLTTCNAGTDYDTVITVLRYEFDGNCWTTFLGCNDDSPLPGCQIGGLNRKSYIQVPTSPGEVFRIVVSGFNGASGNYELTLDQNCN